MRRSRADARPLTTALWFLTASTIMVTGLELTLIPRIEAPLGWLVWSFSLVGAATTIAGLAVWHTRPTSSTGALLAVVGLLVLGASLGNTVQPWLALVGVLVAETPIAALLHLVLAFPSGRLHGRLDRALVTAAYASSVLWQIPIYVFSGSPLAIDALAAAPDPNLVRWADEAQSAVSGAALLAAAVLLGRRWRHQIPSERTALVLGHGYGLATLVAFPFTARVLKPTLGWSPLTLFGVQQLIVLGVPLLFAAATGSGALARTLGLDELAATLSDRRPGRPTAGQALADALGDPSLVVLHQLEDGALVDDRGRPVQPGPAPRRAQVAVTGSTPHAFIDYDTSVVPDRILVEAAARVAALAIEHERLTAELMASQSALEASRLRMLEHGQRERERLARDLHDGVQSRLVVAAIQAGRLARDDHNRPATADRLVAELNATISELRHLVEGVMPPLLYERGLFAAVDELAGHLPLPIELSLSGDDDRLPWPVAVAGYHITREACANALKHAEANRLELTVAVADGELCIDVSDDGQGGAVPTGNGLRGLADRVSTLGGSVRFDSPAGHGTRVEVRLPCGS